MKKKFNKLLVLIFFLISTDSKGFNSSSYLIASTAIKLFDFDRAYIEYKNLKIPLNEAEFLKKLQTLINLGNLYEASNVAKKILEINNLNQEAWVVYLAYAKIYNKNDPIIFFKEINNKSQMPFLEYIFLNTSERIRNKKDIAKSIYEVVQNFISEDLDHKNYSFMLFYLSIANLLDPDFNETYYLSALIYQNINNYSKAETLYKKISANSNLYIISQKNIAINKSKLNLFESGQNKLLKLIKNYPLNKELIVALADLYMHEKKYDQAILNYSTVIELDKTTIEDLWYYLYLRGICYEQTNRWDLAEKDFLHSLKIKHDSPRVLNYLAYGWLERDKNLDISIEMLKKAYESNSDSYYILDSLAWAYYKLGRLQKASELMEKVIEMVPGEAISLDHLGDIYFDMKRKREASFLWKQALDLAKPKDNITNSLEEKLKKYNDR